MRKRLAAERSQKAYGVRTKDQLLADNTSDLVRKATESLAGFDIVNGVPIELTSRRLRLMTKRSRQMLPKIEVSKTQPALLPDFNQTP